jgi:hypothetical protein
MSRDAVVDTLVAVISDRLCEECGPLVVDFFANTGPRPDLCSWDRLRLREIASEHRLVAELFSGQEPTA